MKTYRLKHHLAQAEPDMVAAIERVVEIMRHRYGVPGREAVELLRVELRPSVDRHWQVIITTAHHDEVETAP